MKKPTAPHLAALTLTLVAVVGCTSQAEIDQACAAHPPKMPEAPVLTDGYFIAAYRVPKPALDWISEQLLTRGFSFIETEGRTMPGMGKYLRFSIGEGAAACKSADGLLAKFDPNERLKMADRLVDKGLRPDQCLAVEAIAVPTARYRVTITNHSPPRKPWLDGLRGREDVRVQTTLLDAKENRALADIWSVTLNYQVNISGKPVTDCYRRDELRRLLDETLQPLVAPPSSAPKPVTTRNPVAVTNAAIERIAEDKLPPVTERETELKVLTQRPGGEAIEWRVYRQRENYVAPQMQGVSVGYQSGWRMRLAVNNMWREVPMSWLQEEKRRNFHVKQPIWVIESPRGIGVLALWRHGQMGENYGQGYFILAEYTREGKPLSRLRAQLPLAPKSNPFHALISAPVYRPEGLAFTVTETGSLDERQGLKAGGVKDVTHPILREVDYLLPIGGK